MATIKLYGGDFGTSDQMILRCDLSRAESPVEVDYCNGEGWQPCAYQCADAWHRISGLVEIGKVLAADALELPRADFNCDWTDNV